MRFRGSTSMYVWLFLLLNFIRLKNKTVMLFDGKGHPMQSLEIRKISQSLLKIRQKLRKLQC